MDYFIGQIYAQIHRCHELCLKLIHSSQADGIAGFDIGRQQGVVLVILLANDGITQHQITRKLQTSSSAAGELIGKLERAGYVERRENAADRRTSQVWLTPEGRDVAARYREESGAVLETWGDGFEAEEKSRLLALLEKLGESLEKQIASGGNHRQ